VITSTAVQRAKPGQAEQLESLMQALIEQVNANEPGCTIFQYVRDPNDASSYMVIEQYEDQAALDFHRSTDYLEALLPQLMECLEGPPELSQYEDVFPALRVNRGEPITGAASFFHIGVIVEDLAQAVIRFSEVLGVKFTEPATFHIPCLEDPDPHPFDLVAAFSMTAPPHYELIQAQGDGICSIENANRLLYFAVWETDMANRMKELERQGIGLDATFRRDRSSPPFAMITKPDLLGVRIEYVDATAEHAIDDWVWTGRYEGGTP
jgi:quinol monooxygenase YgiN